MESVLNSFHIPKSDIASLKETWIKVGVAKIQKRFGKDQATKEEIDRGQNAFQVYGPEETSVPI